MFEKLIKKLVTLLVRVTPKFNYCFMKGVPSYEDSLVSIYGKLPLSDIDKVIWSCYDLGDKPPFDDRGKTIYVKKGSVKELYYGVLSKYVFTSHGHFIPEIPKNQKCFNVYHGMPLKGIGLLDNQEGRKDTYLSATSKLYQGIMSRAFGMDLEQTFITGIPRNDLLKNNNPDLVWKKAGIEKKNYKKIFFWLPTYRKSVFGYITENGTEVDNVFNMKDFPTESFQNFLEENECLCILKPHPMAPKKIADKSDNILVIDESWLWDRKLSLYSLLGETDFLVSDISSVMIDYMLLDRPIIVCFEDVEQYRQSRNLIFDPIEDWLPSRAAKTFDELLEEIKNCMLDKDVYRADRTALCKQFHDHLDYDSTQRVIDIMNIGS